jgi:hypothetical protein
MNMAVNEAAVANPWAFDDHLRRAAKRLFDDTLSDEMQAVNRVYRSALLILLDGICTDNPFEIQWALDAVSYVYRKLHVTQMVEGDL